MKPFKWRTAAKALARLNCCKIHELDVLLDATFPPGSDERAVYDANLRDARKVAEEYERRLDSTERADRLRRERGPLTCETYKALWCNTFRAVSGRCQGRQDLALLGLGSLLMYRPFDKVEDKAVEDIATKLVPFDLAVRKYTVRLKHGQSPTKLILTLLAVGLTLLVVGVLTVLAALH